METSEMVKPVEILNKMNNDCSLIETRSGIALTRSYISGIHYVESLSSIPEQENERLLLELKKLQKGIKGIIFSLKRGIVECHLVQFHDENYYLIFRCKTYNTVIPVDTYHINQWVEVIRFYVYSLINERVIIFNSRYSENMKCYETIENMLSERNVFMHIDVYKEDWKFNLVKFESVALVIVKVIRQLLIDFLYKPNFYILTASDYPDGIHDYLYNFSHADISVLAVYAVVKFYVVVQTDSNDMVKIGIWFSKNKIRTSFCSIKNVKISLDIIDFCRDQLNMDINPSLLTYSMIMSHYSEILLNLNNIEQEEQTKNGSRKNL